MEVKDELVTAMSPLVRVGVSEPVEQAAQQGICVEVAARGGFAGLGCRGGDVLGGPDQKLCTGRRSSHTVATRDNPLIVSHILMTWLQIGYDERNGYDDIHRMPLYRYIL